MRADGLIETSASLYVDGFYADFINSVVALLKLSSIFLSADETCVKLRGLRGHCSKSIMWLHTHTRAAVNGHMALKFRSFFDDRIPRC